MKKLTKLMRQALLKVYEDKSIEAINKSTLKALQERKLIDAENKLTNFGERYAISTMPLVKQCAEISLELETIKLPYTGRPEPALLSKYKELGYVGVSCEGMGVLTVLKALMLDKLAEYNYFSEREDACTRFLEAQFVILKDKAKEIIPEISSISKSRYLDNFKEIISKPFISLEYPELTLEFASEIFDALNKDIFIKIAKKIHEDPYLYRNGWPDLTLIKNKEVLFVEVKTSDKLHESQLITIPVMQKIIPSKFSVCRVLK